MIRSLHFTTSEEIHARLRKVGVDPDGIELLEGKARLFNLLVERLDSRTATLLKQEMLSVGGDAAIAWRALDCSRASTDALLMGTSRQLETLASHLARYPHLRDVTREIDDVLTNLGKTRHTLHCRRSGTLNLGERTLLMGILNVTPDSFSDGGCYFDRERAIDRGLQMVEEGADLLDVGGESSRPGSTPLPAEEELRRVLPVIETLGTQVKVPLSIDTYKTTVAQRAIDAGAEIINDISGLRFDPGLAAVAAAEGTPIILMHIRGTPLTMQKDVHYGSLFSEILEDLRASIQRTEASGVDPGQIVIDPGIGFGKLLHHNLLILNHLEEFRILGKPILLGTSRKSFIGKILNAEVDQRLEGTLSSTVIGVLHGAHIVRCHDVLQAKKAVAVADAIRRAEEEEGLTN